MSRTIKAWTSWINRGRTGMVDGPRRPLTGALILIAPLLVTGYAAVRLLGNEQGPGPIWTLSHLLLLAAFAAFGLAIPGMRVLVSGGSAGRRATANVVFAATMVGVVCAFGQTISDVLVGLMAADRDGMNTLFDRLHQYPGIGLAFVGPVLFFLGLPVLIALLVAARPQQVAVWSPIIVAIGTILPIVKLDLLLLAGVLMLLGLAPLGWRLTQGTGISPQVALAGLS